MGSLRQGVLITETTRKKIRFIFDIFAVLVFSCFFIFFVGRIVFRRIEHSINRRDFIDIHQVFNAVCLSGNIFEVEVNIRHYRSLYTVEGTITIDGVVHLSKMMLNPTRTQSAYVELLQSSFHSSPSRYNETKTISTVFYFVENYEFVFIMNWMTPNDRGWGDRVTRTLYGPAETLEDTENIIQTFGRLFEISR